MSTDGVADWRERMGREPWTVSVACYGTLVIVRPTKASGSWESAEPWADDLLPWWQRLGLKALRMKYPKTAAELAEAKALCQRWCDRENLREDAARQLVAMAT